MSGPVFIPAMPGRYVSLQRAAPLPCADTGHVSVNSRDTYHSLISWIRCRNSSIASKYWHPAKIPGCLKLSFKAISKQGLRYPKWTLDGIQAPEYKMVTMQLQNAAVQLFSKPRDAQGPEMLYLLTLKSPGT